LALFEILSPLGVGYLAADTWPGRKIALMMLPEAFTHTAERVPCFEQ